jgi:hypothetical protein
VQIGGHYTSERDILKVIRSLFLDGLRADFERAKGSKAELGRFHEKLAGFRFLDPHAVAVTFSLSPTVS